MTSPAPTGAPQPPPQPAGRTRPALRLLPGRTSARRAPFVLLVGVILAGGLLTLLLLNTLVNQGTFTISALQQRSQVLGDQVQQLGQELAVDSSPGGLAARASALGMVPGGDPQFLRLSDGKVVGAVGVTAPPLPLPPPPRPNTGPHATHVPRAHPSATPSAHPRPSTHPSATPSAHPSPSTHASPAPPGHHATPGPHSSGHRTPSPTGGHR